MIHNDEYLTLGKSALACYAANNNNNKKGHSRGSSSNNIKSKRKNVQNDLKKLGFEEIKYSYLPSVTSSSSSSLSYSTSLKAVIPIESQSNLLDSVIFGEPLVSPVSPYHSYRQVDDSLDRSEQSSSSKQKTPKKQSRQRPKSASNKPGWRHPFIGLSLKLDRTDYLPNDVKRKLLEDDQNQKTLRLEQSKGEKVRMINGKPVYAQISHHKIEWDIKQKVKEDEILKKEKVFKTLTCNRDFHVTDKNGVLYCYDFDGSKIREDEYYMRKKLEEERKAKDEELKASVLKQKEENLRLDKEQGKKWSGLILDKTKYYMEVMEHNKLAEEKFKDNVWKPLKLPTTTFSIYDVKKNRRTRSLPSSIVRHWPEYDNMEIGDVILTIEHCDDCTKHETCTRHDEYHYKKRTQKLKDALHAESLKFAIRFITILKPISKFGTILSNSFEVGAPSTTNRPKSALARTKTWIPPIDPLPTEVKTKANPDHYQNDFNYKSRVGAFEVQIAFKTNKGELKKEILHTKLLSGSWGNDSKIALLFNEFLRRHQVDELFCALPIDKVDFNQDTVFEDGTMNFYFDSRTITMKRQTVGSPDPDLMQDGSFKELSSTQRLKKINSQNVLRRIDSRDLMEAEAKGMKRPSSMGAMSITSDVDLVFSNSFSLVKPSSRPNSPKQSFTLAELSNSPVYYDFKLGKEVHRPISTITMKSDSADNHEDDMKENVTKELEEEERERIDDTDQSLLIDDTNNFKQRTKQTAAKMFFFAYQNMIMKRYSKYFRIWTSFTNKNRTLELENNQKILLQKIEEQQKLLQKSTEKSIAAELVVGLKVESNYKGTGWYEGTISRKRANNTYDITYNNGDVEVQVQAEFIRMKEGFQFSEGFLIEGNYQGRNIWYPGRISKVRNDGKYNILYDDGETEKAVSHPFIRNRAVPSSNTQIEVDMRVEGNYKGKGVWYPGKISVDRQNETYDVIYDDGEQEGAVGKSFLRPIMKQMSPQRRSVLHEGEKIEANYKGRGKWYKGIVSADRGNGTYDVLYDDGETDTVKRDLIRSLRSGLLGSFDLGTTGEVANTIEPTTLTSLPTLSVTSIANITETYAAQPPETQQSPKESADVGDMASNPTESAFENIVSSYGVGSDSKEMVDNDSVATFVAPAAIIGSKSEIVEENNEQVKNDYDTNVISVQASNLDDVASNRQGDGVSGYEQIFEVADNDHVDDIGDYKHLDDETIGIEQVDEVIGTEDDHEVAGNEHVDGIADYKQLDEVASNEHVDGITNYIQVDEVASNEHVDGIADYKQLDEVASNEHVDGITNYIQVDEVASNEHVDGIADYIKVDEVAGNEHVDGIADYIQVDEVAGNEHVDGIANYIQVDEVASNDHVDGIADGIADYIQVHEVAGNEQDVGDDLVNEVTGTEQVNEVASNENVHDTTEQVDEVIGAEQVAGDDILYEVISEQVDEVIGSEQVDDEVIVTEQFDNIASEHVDELIVTEQVDEIADNGHIDDNSVENEDVIPEILPIQVTTKEHIALKIESIKENQMSRVNDLLARFKSDDEDDDFDYDEDFEH